MYAEINAALQAAKVLYEVVKANKELANYSELTAAVAEVNAKLVSATVDTLASLEKQAALNSKVSDLEKELVELKNWEREAERYQLTELCPDVVVFTLKTGMENSQPPHKLHAACFEKRQKGYLQRSTTNTRGVFYKCDTCGSEICDYSHSVELPPPNNGGWGGA